MHRPQHGGRSAEKQNYQILVQRSKYLKINNCLDDDFDDGKNLYCVSKSTMKNLSAQCV